MYDRLRLIHTFNFDCLLQMILNVLSTFRSFHRYWVFFELIYHSNWCFWVWKLFYTWFESKHFKFMGFFFSIKIVRQVLPKNNIGNSPIACWNYLFSFNIFNDFERRERTGKRINFPPKIDFASIEAPEHKASLKRNIN